MTFSENDLADRLQAMAQELVMPAASPDDDIRRGRRRRRRERGVRLAAAAVVAAVALSAAAVVHGQGESRSQVLDSADPVDTVEAGVPVWYDANGLHRGAVVEQTAVEILEPERGAGPGRAVPQRGALALVRSGALYLDPAAGDVWFHPWGGVPQIVGRNSDAGPGGDPHGDTAAWFESRELVVYDTAAGREVSRTRQGVVASGSSGIGGDHYPAGNGFLHVSSEHVTWTDGAEVQRLGVRTGVTSQVEVVGDRYLIDVHGDVQVLGERDPWLPVLRVPGQPDRRYPDLSTHSRLSPSGRYLLSPSNTGVGASIVDRLGGEAWRAVENRYPWIAWSYGGMALVDTESELLACDVGLRECETLPAQRPFLLPTN